MLIEKDLQKIFSQLAVVDSVNIPYDGSQIMVQLLDQSSAFSLTTLIYEGSNYIPLSVRSSLSQKSPFSHPSSLLTSFSVDEQHYQVKLQYYGQRRQLTASNFKNILEEFGSVAEEWRLYLDDQDKNDLVHVPIK
jgi:hypothetical protein